MWWAGRIILYWQAIAGNPAGRGIQRRLLGRAPGGQRYQKDLNTSTTAFYLQLELNGLAALAAIRCKPRRQSIPGYSKINDVPETLMKKLLIAAPFATAFAQAGAAVREADRIVAVVNKDVITEVGLRQRAWPKPSHAEKQTCRRRRSRCCAPRCLKWSPNRCNCNTPSRPGCA